MLKGAGIKAFILFSTVWLTGVTVATAKSLSVPAFVNSAPKDCFAGISSPMPSLSTARTSAVADAARKILRDIGGRYNYEYIDRTSGNVRNPSRTVIDQLSIQSYGFVQDLERRVVQTRWTRDSSNSYVCFVLVRYPDDLVKEMRRLSKGARVIASVARRSGDQFFLNIREINNVHVVMSSAEMHVSKKYRYADFISFFIWPIPSGSKRCNALSFDPVALQASSKTLKLSIYGTKKKPEDYLLGADFTCHIVLKGQDELGKVVYATIEF